MKKFLCVVVFVCILISVFAVELEPFWTLVMAGKNLANPVIWNKHIYSIGDDRALNCVSTSGSFVWRRNTEEYGKFITVSPSGLLFVITASGGVEAFSSQGIPIWSFKLDELPMFPVYFSRDGRLFILQSKTIMCFSRHGVLKWQRKLKSPPARNVCETGTGEILLVLENGDFLRFSLFGNINENKRLKKTISVLSDAPGGYLMACTDASLAYYKVQDGSTAVWQSNEGSVCKALHYKGNSVLVVSNSGLVSMRSITDNSEQWRISLRQSFSGDVYCYSIKNEYYITAGGYGCLVTDRGKLKWECMIPEKDFMPVITENGMVVGVSGKIMRAYRMEAKLTRKKDHPDIVTHKHGIISPESFDLPLLIEQDSTGLMLSEIDTAIEDGTLGEDEVKYANILVRIIGNTEKRRYFPRDFNSFERGQAAELLGKMGSYEYREYLLDEARKKPDVEFATGILKGLGGIAYDPDGRTIEAIKILISGENGFNFLLMKSACQALENLVKFGDEYTAKKAVYVLFSIINGGYSNKIKNFARQTIENVVQ
ncbi:MAG: hypothetical protein CR988_03510 [Treponema sp.]|nr:MAG: hypothetical protein CR988_03510 [Treponema sp.]